MGPLIKVTVGMAAEKKVTVTPEMTVGHVVPGMAAVYGIPMMILHMEMASGTAIASSPAGGAQRSLQERTTVSERHRIDPISHAEIFSFGGFDIVRRRTCFCATDKPTRKYVRSTAIVP
jgi:hypothetical protein